MKRFSSYPRITPDNDYEFDIDLASKQKEIIERILKARMSISGGSLSNLSIPQKRIRTEKFEKVHSNYSKVAQDAHLSANPESVNPTPIKEASKNTFAMTSSASPFVPSQVILASPAVQSEPKKEKPEIYEFELGVKRNNRDFNQDIELKSSTPAISANSESSLPKKSAGFSWSASNTTGSETKVTNLFEPVQTKPIFSSPFFPAGGSQAPVPTSSNFSGFFPAKVDSNIAAPVNPTPPITSNETPAAAKDFFKTSSIEITSSANPAKTETSQSTSNLFSLKSFETQPSEGKVDNKAGSLFSSSTPSSLFGQGVGNNSSLFSASKTVISSNEEKPLAPTAPVGGLFQQSKTTSQETLGDSLIKESKPLTQAGKTESLFQGGSSSINTTFPGSLFQQSVPVTTKTSSGSLFQQSKSVGFEGGLLQENKSVADNFQLKNINYIPKSGLNSSPGGFFDVFKQKTITQSEDEASSLSLPSKKTKLTDEELVNSSQYPSLDPISEVKKSESLFSSNVGTLKTEYITNPLIKKDLESKETTKPEGSLFSFSSTTENSGFKNPATIQNSLLFTSKTENNSSPAGNSLFSNTNTGSSFNPSPPSTALFGSNQSSSSLFPSATPGSLFSLSKPTGSSFTPQSSGSSLFGGSLFAHSNSGSLFGQSTSSFPGSTGQASQPPPPPVKLPSNISSNPFFVQKGEIIDDKAFLEEEGYASGASGSDEDN